MYDKGEGVINQLPIIILLNVDILSNVKFLLISFQLVKVYLKLFWEETTNHQNFNCPGMKTLSQDVLDETLNIHVHRHTDGQADGGRIEVDNEYLQEV